MEANDLVEQELTLPDHEEIADVNDVLPLNPPVNEDAIVQVSLSSYAQLISQL
jgi:hypothetical protein